MTISYGTAPAGESQEHTGTQVRIAGTDQTDLFSTIADALRLR